MRELARRELDEIEESVPRASSPAVRLDCNESPFDLPPALKELALRRIRELSFNRYPEAAALAVRDQIALGAGVTPGQVVLGNGLDEVILMILLAFGTGKRSVIPVPSFSGYRISSILAGADVVGVPLTPWLDIDLDRIIEEARREPGLVFLCSPHNPTGRLAPAGAVEILLRDTKSLIVVDEAYGDFSGTTCLPLVEKHDRLVVLRTFSKALGLAGIRLGYAVAGRETASWLSRARQPYNVSSLSLAVAGVVLGNTGFVHETVSRVVSERERLFQALMAVPGVVPFPSSANFILFRTPRPAWEVDEGLRRRGVAVRVFPGERSLSGCLRVTVGTPAEDDAFLDALGRLMVNEDQRAIIGGGCHA